MNSNGNCTRAKIVPFIRGSLLTRCRTWSIDARRDVCLQGYPQGFLSRSPAEMRVRSRLTREITSNSFRQIRRQWWNGQRSQREIALWESLNLEPNLRKCKNMSKCTRNMSLQRRRECDRSVAVMLEDHPRTRNRG